MTALSMQTSSETSTKATTGHVMSSQDASQSGTKCQMKRSKESQTSTMFMARLVSDTKKEGKNAAKQGKSKSNH